MVLNRKRFLFYPEIFFCVILFVGTGVLFLFVLRKDMLPHPESLSETPKLDDRCPALSAASRMTMLVGDLKV